MPAWKITILGTLIGIWLGTPVSVANGRPEPGAVFRDVCWRPEGKWQRVTWPDVEELRAREFLPNKVNRIVINDLEHAVRAEVVIEMLLCHAGTVDKRVRVNGHEWITIPESTHIPATFGRGPPGTEYQSMRYPVVSVPLEQLRQGENRFEFTCGPGTGLGSRWPQWLLYGVTFRVYHDAAKKAHPTGRIVSPRQGESLGANPRLRAETGGPSPIDRVDFVGLYDDFNWEGDGLFRQWHYRTLYGRMFNNMATAKSGRYEAVWNTTWIPSQQKPIRIAAWITDQTGLCFVTPSVDNLSLRRGTEVRMVRPHDVPKSWSTRAGKKQACKMDIDGDLTGATVAKIVLSTWNGVVADEIGLNGHRVMGGIGKNHDLSHDEFEVPLNLLRAGTNKFHTFSETEHHGIEIQWPGPVLFIRFADQGAGNEQQSPVKVP